MIKLTCEASLIKAILRKYWNSVPGQKQPVLCCYSDFDMANEQPISLYPKQGESLYSCNLQLLTEGQVNYELQTSIITQSLREQR